MKNVYNILEEIENHFRNEPNTNSVKFGVFNETDLKKQTIFPLIQFQIVEITYVGQTVDFTLAVMALDEVAEYLYEEFENKLAGWGMEIEISTVNDVTIC